MSASRTIRDLARHSCLSTCLPSFPLRQTFLFFLHLTLSHPLVFPLLGTCSPHTAPQPARLSPPGVSSNGISDGVPYSPCEKVQPSASTLYLTFLIYFFLKNLPPSTIFIYIYFFSSILSDIVFGLLLSSQKLHSTWHIVGAQ